MGCHGHLARTSCARRQRKRPKHQKNRRLSLIAHKSPQSEKSFSCLRTPEEESGGSQAETGPRPEELPGIGSFATWQRAVIDSE